MDTSVDGPSYRQVDEEWQDLPSGPDAGAVDVGDHRAATAQHHGRDRRGVAVPEAPRQQGRRPIRVGGGAERSYGQIAAPQREPPDEADANGFGRRLIHE